VVILAWRCTLYVSVTMEKFVVIFTMAVTGLLMMTTDVNVRADEDDTNEQDIG